jgi:hypothetical protein
LGCACEVVGRRREKSILSIMGTRLEQYTPEEQHVTSEDPEDRPISPIEGVGPMHRTGAESLAAERGAS